MITRYRHLKRYRQIVSVFIKHGFGTVIDQLGILNYLNIRRRLTPAVDAGKKHEKLSVGERLRLALEELGPAFVKLGQIISTRPDLLPQGIIHELEKLQDDVPPFSFEDVKSVIENEFGEKLENVFAEFDETPLAAASIAQVHSGKLPAGQRVVIKVQRPGIERVIEQDLRILEDLAFFVDHYTKYGRLYDFGRMVKEFRATLRSELDFRTEAENAEVFRKNFFKDKGVAVPAVYWSHTTRRVLTMEYINGIRLNDFEALRVAGVDRALIARNLSSSILNQILRDGFFHGDPHPGNIMVLPDNTIVFLDLGMVGKLDERHKAQFLKMLLGIGFKNSRYIISALMDLDALSERANSRRIKKEIDALLDKYTAVSLSDIKIGEVFSEIFNLAYRYNIRIPGEFTMLAKSLVTLEGIVEKLDPELNVLEIAQPLAKKMALKTFSPEGWAKHLFEVMAEYGSLIKEFPVSMLDLLRKIQSEDFAFQFKFKGLEDIVRHADRIANRLSFSIVLLAVSIILSGIIIGSGMSAHTSVEIYLFNLTALRIGLIVAVAIATGLLYSIFRSGRL